MININFVKSSSVISERQIVKQMYAYLQALYTQHGVERFISTVTVCLDTSQSSATE